MRSSTDSASPVTDCLRARHKVFSLNKAVDSVQNLANRIPGAEKGHCTVLPLQPNMAMTVEATWSCRVPAPKENVSAKFGLGVTCDSAETDQTSQVLPPHLLCQAAGAGLQAVCVIARPPARSCSL